MSKTPDPLRFYQVHLWLRRWLMPKIVWLDRLRLLRFLAPVRRPRPEVSSVL